MALHLSLLKTPEECTEVIESLNEEKTQLERRLRNKGEELEGKAERISSTTAAIAASEATIVGYQNAISAMTDAKDIRDFELKIEREEVKLKSSLNRQAGYPIAKYVQDQVGELELQAQVQVFVSSIAEVEAHKAALEAGG